MHLGHLKLTKLFYLVRSELEKWAHVDIDV